MNVFSQLLLVIHDEEASLKPDTTGRVFRT